MEFKTDTEDMVMAINGKLFTLLMDLLHDLSGHFKGDNYTISIEVMEGFVRVSRTPKERACIQMKEGSA